ncbi:MAG TPA: Calx-beta domain-containing protein, partial [Herpetosiphonaceae bacterium]
VPILDDIQGEANETVTLTLSNPSNATLGAPSSATLTISANDTLSFSGVFSIHENGGAETITVKLSGPSSVPVTVEYATGNGTAIAGSDYTATSGTLTFTPGETSKTFAVPILDDIQGEANETVTLTLSNPSNATLGAPSSATLTINANDTLTFSASSYRVNESSSAATITVKLSGPSSIPVTVEYATSNGTATAGSDYTATSGILTFNPGETSKTFAVPFINDTVDEPDETVTISLGNPGNAVLGSPATTTLTIVDND